MNKLPIHIVSFDVPYPADYGGAIAVFNEIKALHACGERIILHCFEYGRGQQNELLKYCKEVHYYKRRLNLFLLLRGVPYIVASRANRQLLKNIEDTPGLVLLQGIHCTWFIYHGELTEAVVRLHNVEYIYYHRLAETAGNVLKKLYYLAESYLLKKYESKLAAMAGFAVLSKRDEEIYRKELKAEKVQYIPALVNSSQVESLAGSGTYGLYQGNLSVSENEEAVTKLLNEVFGKLPYPFIIAGKNPSSALKKRIEAFENVTLHENVSEREMEEFIRNAHIHYIHSVNATGIKIKLLNALTHGRFVLANENAVAGSGLESLCSIAGSGEEYIKITKELFSREFDGIEIECRTRVLIREYDDKRNVQLLLKKLREEKLLAGGDTR